MQYIVYCQAWEEIEQLENRPDGYTLHLNRKDHEQWVARFLKAQASHYSVGEAPQKQTLPKGEVRVLKVGQHTFKDLQTQGDFGMWGKPHINSKFGKLPPENGVLT